jgi:hypothetical protein
MASSMRLTLAVSDTVMKNLDYNCYYTSLTLTVCIVFPLPSYKNVILT